MASAPEHTDDMQWAHFSWDFIHFLSFYIDEFESEDIEAQKAFQQMIQGLQAYLPCTACRKHLAKYIKENPMPTPGKNATDAFLNARWCVDLHNAINVRQHKSIVPFNKVKAHYVDGAAKPSCPPQFDANQNFKKDNNKEREQTLIKPITITVAVIVIFFVVLALILQTVTLVRR